MAQVSANAAEFQQLQQTTDAFFAGGGADTQQEAAQTVFSLKSAGAMDQLELFRQLRATGVVGNPAQMASAARTLTQTLGRKETGSFRDIVGKAFAASEFSTSTAEQLLEHTALSGGSARALGIGDEELLGASAVLSSATGSASRGGTQLAALLRESMKDEGLKGAGSLGAIINQLRSRDPSTGGLSSAEAIAAFQTLDLQRATVGDAVRKIRQAEQTDLAGQKLRIASSDPAQRSANLALQAENEEILSQKRKGTIRGLITAAQKKEIAATRNAGTNEFLIDMAELLQGIHQRLLPERQEAQALLGKDRIKPFLDEDTREALIDAINNQTEVIRQQGGTNPTLHDE